MSELDWTSRAAMGHADALARAAVGHSCGVVPLHLACDVCLGPLDDEESLYADQCSSCIEEAGGLSCLNATLRLDEPGWVARVSALREELYAKGKGKGKNQWARAQAKEARAKSKADSLARAAATMAVHCTRTASACRSACGVCGEPLGIDNIYENGGPPSASRWGPPSADQCNSCWNAILALAPIDEAEQIDQACPDAWAAHSNNPSGDAGALAGALKGVGSGKGYVFRFKGHGKGKFFGSRVLALARVMHPVYQQRLGLDPKEELWTSWGERRLIWGGPELQDERTLSHYDIQKGTVLYLSLRLISIRMGLRASDKLHPDYIGAL